MIGAQLIFLALVSKMRTRRSHPEQTWEFDSSNPKRRLLADIF
jgi:hypothetical protein